MILNDEDIAKLSLSPKQLLSAKSVYKAMREANKLGVHFWDNYGTLTAYNAKKISVPIMVDDQSDRNKMECSDVHFDATSSEVLYYENLRNFHAGNADDQFFAEII